MITTLPFYTEYKLNPTLKKLVAAAGGIDKVDSNAVASWLSALLFQDSGREGDGQRRALSRQSLFDALKQEHSFKADGIMGPADVANHIPPGCIVMTQVKNGKLVRTYPKKPGTFDCNKKNLVEIKMDLSCTRSRQTGDDHAEVGAGQHAWSRGADRHHRVDRGIRGRARGRRAS